MPVGALCIIVTILVAGFLAEPDRYAIGYEPTQPMPFSHLIHAGINHIPCEYCHTNAGRSRYATVPAFQTCLNCHHFVNSPYSKTIESLVKSDKSLEWKRIYHLPQHVFFDHRAHINAGIQCQSCHGPVQKMNVVRRVMNMRMGRCLACHRHPEPYLPPNSSIKRGPTDCTACHR